MKTFPWGLVSPSNSSIFMPTSSESPRAFTPTAAVGPQAMKCLPPWSATQPLGRLQALAKVRSVSSASKSTEIASKPKVFSRYSVPTRLGSSVTLARACQRIRGVAAPRPLSHAMAMSAIRRETPPLPQVLGGRTSLSTLSPDGTQPPPALSLNAWTQTGGLSPSSRHAQTDSFGLWRGGLERGERPERARAKVGEGTGEWFAHSAPGSERRSPRPSHLGATSRQSQRRSGSRDTPPFPGR